MTMSQKAFYNNPVALQEAHYPNDDKEITVHDTVYGTIEKIFQ